jgi:hypothetical protein
MHGTQQVADVSAASQQQPDRGLLRCLLRWLLILLEQRLYPVLQLAAGDVMALCTTGEHHVRLTMHGQQLTQCKHLLLWMLLKARLHHAVTEHAMITHKGVTNGVVLH